MATGVVTGKPETITKKVESDLSAKQYYLVNIDATDEELIVLASGVTETPFVLQEGVDGSVADGQAAIAVGGTTKVKLGGTVAPGDLLTSDGSGKAIATTSNGNFYGLVALEIGVANDIILAKVSQGIV